MFTDRAFIGRRVRRAHHSQTGWSYAEVLVATALLALALAPALEALQTSLLGAAIHEERAVHQQRMVTRLEQLLAEPFVDLDKAAAVAGSEKVPTSYSDSVNTADGRTVNRQVYLWSYDGDNADGDDDPFTGNDEGLLWVRVAIDGSEQALETVIDNN